MNLQNEELIIWMNKNKNYVMLILHQFKLMTIHGFGILLILVARMKIYIAFDKVLNESPVQFEKPECTDMIHEGRRILEEPP